MRYVNFRENQAHGPKRRDKARQDHRAEKGNPRFAIMGQPGFRMAAGINRIVPAAAKSAPGKR